MHKLLQRDGVAVSYSALYRYAVRHLGFSEKSLTVQMDDVSPGEVAEVDFGRLGLVPDAETGKSRVLHALIVTLSLSESASPVEAVSTVLSDDSTFMNHAIANSVGAAESVA